MEYKYISVHRVLLVYIEYCCLLSLQVQFGVIRCISGFHRPGTCCISETANRRAKRTKNLGAMGKYKVYMCTFDCQMFKFSLGSLGAFPILAHLVHAVSQKRQIVERNGPKFGTQG